MSTCASPRLRHAGARRPLQRADRRHDPHRRRAVFPLTSPPPPTSPLFPYTTLFRSLPLILNHHIHLCNSPCLIIKLHIETLFPWHRSPQSTAYGDIQRRRRLFHK